MKKFISLLLLIAISAFMVSAQTTDKTVALDPAVRIGRLDNGMTYYIRHHDNPAERADFYIAHNVGALQEDDDQDGLAHFLEHMAFNGTKHFPKKSMLEFLAANGVMFGSNVNAYTSKAETVYNLSNIPLLRDSFVDSVLLILHDWSSYISCDQEEIEAERGVVREEWRRSDEPRSRTTRKNAEFEYMGSKHARRTVLGNWEVINNFDREQLIDFYHKWYRPDLQAIIVVGDIDPDDMEGRIKRIFSQIPAAKNPTPKEVYGIPCTEEPVIGLVTDPDIVYLTAKIYYKQPYPAAEERMTVSSARYDLCRNLFVNMLSERFARAEKSGVNKNYKKVVSVGSALGTMRNTIMLTVMPNGDELAQGLEGALQELKRLEQNGFTVAEFDDAKARYAKSKQVYIEPAATTIKNDYYVRQYVNHFLRNTPYMTAGDRYDLTRELFDSLTLEDINGMIPHMLTESEQLIIYTVNEDNTGVVPTDEETFAIIAEVNDMLLPQLDTNVEKANLTVDGVVPGSVKKVKHLKYFGAQEWTLSNGARVVWQQVDDIAGPVQMQLYACAPLGFSRNNDIPALDILNRYLFTGMGVRDADKTAVAAALNAYNFSIHQTVGRTRTTLKGASPAGDFEAMMRMTYLYITEPNFTEKDYNTFLARYRDGLSRPESSSSEFNRERLEKLYANHPWTVSATPADCDRLNADAAYRMYVEQYGNAADFTFFITGTMSAEEVRPIVEQYIASLPSTGKKTKVPSLKPERVKGDNEFMRDVDEAKVTVPKASVSRDYYGPSSYDAAAAMTMNYFRYILGERYMHSIREEKGGTYYVGVKGELEYDKKNPGYIIDISFETDPELADDLLSEVSRGISDLAAEGPSEREMTETRLYLLKRNSERKPVQQKTVRYWNERLVERHITGRDITDDDDDVIEDVTADDVRKLAVAVEKNNRFTSVFIRR